MKNKSAASIAAGIALGSAGAPSSLFPWPASLPGLGTRSVIPIDTCRDCPPGIHVAASSTFVAYGGRPTCLGCARRRAKGAAA